MSKKAYSLRKCTPTSCYICLSFCCCCYRYSKPCVPLPTLVLFSSCLQLTLPAVCPALQHILASMGCGRPGGLASGDTLPAWGTDVPLYRCGNGAPRGGRGTPGRRGTVLASRIGTLQGRVDGRQLCVWRSFCVRVCACRVWRDVGNGSPRNELKPWNSPSGWESR